VALTAHDRAFLIFEVTAFAIQVKRPSQARLSAGTLLTMALGTTQVLGRLIFQLYAIFINMMAFVAVFNFSRFIVLIMLEKDGGPLIDRKADVLDYLHILL
jgi:hypothetical protein